MSCPWVRAASGEVIVSSCALHQCRLCVGCDDEVDPLAYAVGVTVSSVVRMGASLVGTASETAWRHEVCPRHALADASLVTYARVVGCFPPSMVVGSPGVKGLVEAASRLAPL